MGRSTAKPTDDDETTAIGPIRKSVREEMRQQKPDGVTWEFFLSNAVNAYAGDGFTEEQERRILEISRGALEDEVVNKLSQQLVERKSMADE